MLCVQKQIKLAMKFDRSVSLIVFLCDVYQYMVNRVNNAKGQQREKKKT